MKLEDLIGEEEAKKLKGEPFGINPEESYDRKGFVKRAGDLFAVEEYYARLGKNQGDTAALNGLVGLLMRYFSGNETSKRGLSTEMSKNPHMALGGADSFLDAGYDAMARFVGNKRDELLDKLSAEQLFSLFINPSLSFYKTGNKEDDKISEIRGKALEMQEAAREGRDINSVIGEQVKEFSDKLPEEQQRFNARYGISITGIVAGAIRGKYISLFRDARGELDKGKLKNYLRRNYQAAHNFIAKVPDEEKEGYWNANLKHHYIEIARVLHESEKAEQKKADNTGKEERKAEARELGLAA